MVEDVLAEHLLLGKYEPGSTIVVDKARPVSRTTSTGRPAASARSARRRCGYGSRQGRGDRGHPRRPRDEGRLDRRAEDARASRRRGAQPRGRALRRAAPRCARPRTASARPTRSASSRWPRPACARSPTRPARSSPTTAGRPRAASSPRPSRAAGRCSSRSRRSSRPTGYGTPARRASGLDPNRLSLLIAVLGRRAGIGLGSHDVYANLAGGLAVDEPGLDLPLALALASSLRDRPIAAGTVAIGEVGLLGELRAGRRARASAARGGPARLRAGDRAAAGRGRREPPADRWPGHRAPWRPSRDAIDGRARRARPAAVARPSPAMLG